jgi:hypothetical protein
MIIARGLGLLSGALCVRAFPRGNADRCQGAEAGYEGVEELGLWRSFGKRGGGRRAADADNPFLECTLP